MRKAVGVGIGITAIVVVGLAFVSMSSKNPLAEIASDVQNTTSDNPETTTFEEQTGVTDIQQQVKVSNTVGLVSETYTVQDGSDLVIKFNTASAEAAYLVGTATVQGSNSVWLQILNSDGECSGMCSSKLVWGDSSFGFGKDNPDNNDVRLRVFTGSSQQLMLSTQSSTPQTITLDLSIVYEGTEMQEPTQQADSAETPSETFNIPG